MVSQLRHFRRWDVRRLMIVPKHPCWHVLSMLIALPAWQVRRFPILSVNAGDNVVLSMMRKPYQLIYQTMLLTLRMIPLRRRRFARVVVPLSLLRVTVRFLPQLWDGSQWKLRVRAPSFSASYGVLQMKHSVRLPQVLIRTSSNKSSWFPLSKHRAIMLSTILTVCASDSGFPKCVRQSFRQTRRRLRINFRRLLRGYVKHVLRFRGGVRSWRKLWIEKSIRSLEDSATYHEASGECLHDELPKLSAESTRLGELFKNTRAGAAETFGEIRCKRCRCQIHR